MSERIAGVGIIGCGVISAAYLKAARFFPQIEIRALADLDRWITDHLRVAAAA